jgi:hypothetical protein
MRDLMEDDLSVVRTEMSRTPTRSVRSFFKANLSKEKKIEAMLRYVT